MYQSFRRPSRGGFQQSRRPAYRMKSFDPSQFVKKAVVEPQEEVAITHSFADFQLDPQLYSNIVRKGYTQPTAIQDQAILPGLAGRDIVGLAQTGSGKTVAFLIPMIQKLIKNPKQSVLIIAPTRELAVQISEELAWLTAGLKMYSTVCIGGVNIRPQIERLRRNPHFVIGTPGRLKDLSAQRAINFNNYQNVVLDEVDRMLDMGFIADIRYISGMLPKARQTLFFSATLPINVQSVMNSLLNDPVRISVKTRSTSANIDQDIVKVQGRPKVDVLHELLQNQNMEKVIVFLRTKHGTEKLHRLLTVRGVRVEAIHGNKSQNQRQRAIQLFKKNQVRVLLATDVASRGLDIDNVTHVINYDLPETMEDYIHRIGRTGRADKKGIALTLV